MLTYCVGVAHLSHLQHSPPFTRERSRLRKPTCNLPMLDGSASCHSVNLFYRPMSTFIIPDPHVYNEWSNWWSHYWESTFIAAFEIVTLRDLLDKHLFINNLFSNNIFHTRLTVIIFCTQQKNVSLGLSVISIGVNCESWRCYCFMDDPVLSFLSVC